MNFELHTIESAPNEIKAELEAAQKAYGTIPNLYRGLAENPAALKVYLSFNENLNAYGVLSPVEQQVAYLTASTENGCTYCVGAHSVLAQMAEIPSSALTELRNQTELSDKKLNAIRNLTLSAVQNRGNIPDSDLQDFTEAGYNQAHLLEILTIVAQKTLSNYFNHIANTPLDDMFSSQAWSK